MATTDRVLKARVERGAALLDAKQPGWAPRIDVPTLDMSNCFHCVLGQAYGSYGIGVRALGLASLESSERVHVSAVVHGFEQLLAINAINEQYPRLTPLWREAIEARCGRER